MPLGTTGFAVAATGGSPYLNLRLIGGGDCAPDESRSLPASCFRLCCVSAGRAVFTAGETVLAAAAGQAVFLPPGETVFYRAEGSEPAACFVLAFDGKMAKELAERAGFSVPSVVPIPDDGIVPLIADTAARLRAVPPNGTDLIAPERLIRILRLFAEAGQDEARPERSKNRYVREAAAYVRRHYAEAINVASVAETLAIDRSYFFRVFKAETGLSPIAYLNGVRIEKARQLLAETSLPITQVAAASGFASPSAFYRMFHLRYGTSPSQYRRRGAGE